ncbi:MAG TPA: hypothetical protein VKQ32_16785 [Polyangia bacterium]|nr:hypothetical protein [Polyangia bacterium]
MPNRSLSPALLALILVAGCKSSETADAGVSDAAYDSGLCGDAAACATGQLCVSHQNCTNLVCSPVPASGTCPSGTSETQSCPDGGPPGCIAGCAATFGCQPRPAGCATVDCSCATALCAPDSCIATMGDRVACATQ